MCSGRKVCAAVVNIDAESLLDVRQPVFVRYDVTRVELGGRAGPRQGSCPMLGLLQRKVGGAVGTLARAAHLTLYSLFCPLKARRKEREGDGAQGDPKLYLEEALLERKLPDVDMRQMVEIPEGIDYNEWLASHTLALFDHVNLIYGTVSEFCTAAACPDMSGPGARAYPWFDEKGKKTRVAAPQYIDYVMTFTQKTVSDENIFPTKYANEFPTSFESIVRKILRLLFHVVAHLYAAHFREVALLRLNSHLNLTFAHMTALHRRFGLIEPKETEVLRDLEVALRLTDEPLTPQQLQQMQQLHHDQQHMCGGGGAEESPAAVDGDASLRPIVAQPGSQVRPPHTSPPSPSPSLSAGPPLLNAPPSPA